VIAIRASLVSDLVFVLMGYSRALRVGVGCRLAYGFPSSPVDLFGDLVVSFQRLVVVDQGRAG
jgi:hypothetical protein